MRKFLFILFGAMFALTACAESSVTQDVAVTAAWNALDPVTTSHKRENFLVASAQQVAGEDIIQKFANERMNAYCWGTRVPANAPIDARTTYWFVHLRRREMTPVPVTRVSPTQPPAIPDWNIPEAFFLIDLRTGKVVARNILCVVT